MTLTEPVLIKWFLHKNNPNHFQYLEGGLLEPKPFFSFIQKQKKLPVNADPHYTQCYSFIDFCKNMFVYCSPIDITVNTKIDNGNFVSWIDQFGNDFFNEYIATRRWGDTFGLTIGPRVCFYSDESVLLEVLPLILIPPIVNTLFVPGRMNIGKIIRPIDFSFELINSETQIIIKRGDPLFLMRFITEGNRPVAFERVFQDEKLTIATAASTGFKMCSKKTSLEKLYSNLDLVLRKLGFKSKVK